MNFKYKLFLLFFGLPILSCSNDDDGNTGSNPTSNQPPEPFNLINVVFDDKIWFIGGREESTIINDAWVPD